MRFVRFELENGKRIYINPAIIESVAEHNADNSIARIYCVGADNPYLVKCTPEEAIKRIHMTTIMTVSNPAIEQMLGGEE